MLKKGLLKEYHAVLKGFFKSTDVLIVFASFCFCYYIKFDTFDLKGNYFVFVISSLFIFYIIANIFNLYKPWRGESLQAELLSLSSVFAVFITVLSLLLFLLKIGHEFSREWFFASLVLSWLLLCTSRGMLRTILRKLRRSGLNQRQVCAVIIDEKAIRLYKRVVSDKNMGIQITAIFSDDAVVAGESNFHGNIVHLKEYLKNANLDQLWIFGSLKYEDVINKVIDCAKDKPIPIRYVPDITSLKLLSHSFSQVAGLTILNIQESPINTVSKIVFKRTEDILFSMIFITMLSPLYLVIALMIKLTSKGPVFYRQVRISYDSKPFYILKFRSMPAGIEKGSGVVWAKEGENRATWFGSLLRKTSLDEIPQFFNVLKGDMSIVGPRPERPKFIRIFKEQVPDYMKKHIVKAGITGWAQVNGWRGNTDIHKRIEYDLYYIKYWSLWFDLKIIFMTVLRGFINKNAY